jgi:hypothetical protein
MVQFDIMYLVMISRYPLFYNMQGGICVLLFHSSAIHKWKDEMSNYNQPTKKDILEEEYLGLKR